MSLLSRGYFKYRATIVKSMYQFGEVTTSKEILYARNKEELEFECNYFIEKHTKFKKEENGKVVIDCHARVVKREHIIQVEEVEEY